MTPEPETVPPAAWAWGLLILVIVVGMAVLSLLPPGCGGPQGPQWFRQDGRGSPVGRDAVGTTAGRPGVLSAFQEFSKRTAVLEVFHDFPTARAGTESRKPV